MEVHCEEAMSRQNIAKRKNGGKNVKKHNSAASGCPSSSTTEISTVRVKEIIQIDRRVHVINAKLGEIYRTVQSMASDVLRCSEVCALWLALALSEEHKVTRKMCTLMFFQRHHFNGQHFNTGIELELGSLQTAIEQIC